MFDIEKKLAELTLEQKVAQLFLQNFVSYEKLPESFVEVNKKGLLGGIIFFSGANVNNIEQLRRLTTDIQSHASESPHGLPFLLTLDQEGGQLTSLHRGATIFPGNMAMGFANNSELTEEVARHVGKELKYAGININFAPVVDVSYDSRNGVPIVDNRMFSSQPEVVSNMGQSYIKGVQDAGVNACAKHFPGQRLCAEDTHHALDVIDYDMERLEKVEFAPFRKAIAEGVKSIMTHHGVYTAFDDKPATLSKPTMDYLRNELGFDGLVITDDLIMKAVEDRWPNKEAVVMAINAGCDVVICGGAEPWFVDHVTAAVNNGEIAVERIDEACTRVLRIKAAKGFGKPSSDKNFSKEDGDKVSYAISKEALIQYKDEEGLLPLRNLQDKRVNVILANPARLVMSDTVNYYDISLKKIIEDKGYHPYVKESFMPWHPVKEEILSLFDMGFTTDVLIFTTVNAFRFEQQIEVLKQIHALSHRPKIISVATRSPDDVKVLAPYSDVVLATGGITPLLMEALVDAIFGNGQFTENEAKKL